MRKKKEQVRYNPAWSAVKRADRTKFAITGGYLRWITLFYIVLGLSMAVLLIKMVFHAVSLDTAEYEEDYMAAMNMCNAAFMFFFVYMLNAVMPGSRKTESRSKVDGCQFLYKVFACMPVKRVTIVKLSFRYFITMATFNLGMMLLANGLTLFLPVFDPTKGSIAIISMLLALVQLALYWGQFSSYCRKRSARSILSVAGLIVFYIFWFGFMNGAFDRLFELEAVRAMAGVPAILVCVAAYAAVWIIEKAVIETKAASSSWMDE